MMTLQSVPMTSDLYQPKVSLLVAFFRDMFKQTRPMIKPIISVARCAVSHMIAIEPAKIPPVSWAAMKNSETAETLHNLP